MQISKIFLGKRQWWSYKVLSRILTRELLGHTPSPKDTPPPLIHVVIKWWAAVHEHQGQFQIMNLYELVIILIYKSSS